VITLRSNGLPVAYRVSAIEAGKKTGDIKNPNGETIGVHRAARGFFRQVEKRGAFAVPLFACPETVFAGSPPPAEFVGSYLSITLFEDLPHGIYDPGNAHVRRYRDLGCYTRYLHP